MAIIEKILKAIVDRLVEQRIQELIVNDTPKIAKLKIGVSGKKVSGWDVIQNNPKEIKLCINCIDDNGFTYCTVYNADDVSQLRHLLDNFKPSWSQFTSCALHIKPVGSSSSIIESLVPSGNLYESIEIYKICDGVMAWIDERPELLV